jgi:hypothetical protein
MSGKRHRDIHRRIEAVISDPAHTEIRKYFSHKICLTPNGVNQLTIYMCNPSHKIGVQWGSQMLQAAFTWRQDNMTHENRNSLMNERDAHIEAWLAERLNEASSLIPLLISGVNDETADMLNTAMEAAKTHPSMGETSFCVDYNEQTGRYRMCATIPDHKNSERSFHSICLFDNKQDGMTGRIRDWIEFIASDMTRWTSVDVE